MSYILGLTGPVSFDQAAVLLEDGRIVAAAEEERFTGVKHHRYGPPINAAGFCLGYAGIRPQDLDGVSIGWGSRAYWARSLAGQMVKSPYLAFNLPTFACDLRRYWGLGFLKGFNGGVEYHRHHLAHMASAYYCSGFDRANILSIDESGEAESTVIGVGSGQDIEVVASFDWVDSLGRLYRQYTEYLGFLGNCDEYKVMGLAAFGRERFPTGHLVRMTPDGYTTRTPHFYMSLLRTAAKRMDSALKPYGRKLGLEDYLRHGPRRMPDEQIGERHKSVAATIQWLYESALVHLAGIAHEQTGIRDFCIAGGCGLNCSANGKLLAQDFVDDIFVQPASSDAGSALGAALLNAQEGRKVGGRLTDAGLGPEYAAGEMENGLIAEGLRYERCEDIEARTAELLAEDKVVGWFQGRMEFGPRALGHRSILANPANPGNKDRVNWMKRRDAWRPFAPSLLEEDMKRYFDTGHKNALMTVAQEVRPERRGEIPAVVHVDGTARYQTVDRAHGRYHSLLEKFKERTGLPVLLNTSLNVRGQPIVRAPGAGAALLRTQRLDFLVMGDYLASVK
jgi:carbamoyltransferase